MKNTILRIALPILKAFGLELEAKDDNDTGADDLAGAAMVYAADVTEAVLNKSAIPYPPDVLLRAAKKSNEAATTAPLAQVPAE